MAITTLDGLLAGMRAPQPFAKVGATTSALGYRAWTPWYSAGVPGASSANTAGVNGQAVTPALGVSVAGRIPRDNPSAGLEARLARFAATVSQPGTLWIVDRLWQNSGLLATSISAQAITGATLPTRDNNGANLGHGVFAGIEWSTVGGLGTPTVTLTYTDEAGATGRTATLAAVSSPTAGTVELFQLAAGDPGIRAPPGR